MFVHIAASLVYKPELTVSFETSYSDFYVFFDNNYYYASYTSGTTYIKAYYLYFQPTRVQFFSVKLNLRRFNDVVKSYII